MILDTIVEDKKIRLKEHKARISPAQIRRMAEEYEGASPSFLAGLQKRGFPLSGNLRRRLRVSETYRAK